LAVEGLQQEPADDRGQVGVVVEDRLGGAGAEGLLVAQFATAEQGKDPGAEGVEGGAGVGTVWRRGEIGGRGPGPPPTAAGRPGETARTGGPGGPGPGR